MDGVFRHMISSRTRLLPCALFGAFLGSANAQPYLPGAEPPPLFQPLLRDPPSAPTLKGRFTFAAVGDLIYSTPVSVETDPQLAQVIRILRNADAALGNQEGPIGDLKQFSGWPSGEGLLLAQPSVALSNRTLGLGMVSLANNHATDFSPAGLLETMRLLDSAGIVHAGGGATLAAARAPAYLDTPKARVALISTASSFKPRAIANDAINEMPARAGISVLRTTRVSLVTPDEMDRLRRIATRQSFGRSMPAAAGAAEIVLNDTVYRVSDIPGLTYEMNAHDHYAILAAIHAAKEAANLVVFTIHAHESATGIDDDNPQPPDFLIQLFHEAVQAGADIVVGGGPHALRGIEVYRGRPLFYGMGAFFLNGRIYLAQDTLQDNPTWMRAPSADARKPPIRTTSSGNPLAWYEGLVAVTEFTGPRLSEVRLYPLDLQPEGTGGQRGTPRMAGEALARSILKTLQEDSRQFGTDIKIKGSVGLIHPVELAR
jgi:poly-gamma-glutamate synthesis protein (capsule biosynthesis protein)